MCTIQEVSYQTVTTQHWVVTAWWFDLYFFLSFKFDLHSAHAQSGFLGMPYFVPDVWKGSIAAPDSGFHLILCWYRVCVRERAGVPQVSYRRENDCLLKTGPLNADGCCRAFLIQSRMAQAFLWYASDFTADTAALI